MELAENHGVVIHLDKLLFCGDSRMITEAGSEDKDRVALVHEMAGYGGAASPENSAGKGVIVGD